MVRSVYRTIPHQIAEGVRTDIYTGRYKENAELKEQDLADQFMVSRGTIRSALMILVSEGVVKSVPNKGMRVANHPSGEALTLIIELRNRIEEFVLQDVFQVLRDNHLEEWKQILMDIQQASQLDDLETFIDADIRFHGFLISLHPDQHIRDLWEATRTRMMMRYSRLENLKSGYEEHERIFQAVQAGNLEKAIESLHRNIL